MDNLFFAASKTIGMAARAETWLILLMGLCLLAIWRNRRGPALITGGVTFATLLTLTLFPLGDLLLKPLESRYPITPPLSQVDGIIVLGGGEAVAPYRAWGGVQMNDGGERFTEAVTLARRYPAAKVIFTGGEAGLGHKGSTLGPSNIAMQVWTDLGLDPARITLESKSRNTVENARFTRDLLQPRPDQHWVLITSAFHMPRSVASFANAGWVNVTPWPVDFRSGDMASAPYWRLDSSLMDLDIALKEYLGLFVYGITGR
jgi:uncharacterized SAM-binding protein YcdF (DUF218 family)